MPRRRRVLLFIGLIACVVVGLGFAGRQWIIRSYIAYRIHQLHVLTPATHIGSLAEARFYWDVAGLRLQRDERARRFAPRLEPLVRLLSKRQRKGRDVALSTHIYREVRWWINFTDDNARASQRIDDLAASLADGVDQTAAEQQSRADGSWGAGYTVWFMKLYGSVNDALSRGAEPQYPLRFLDRINSPAALSEHLNTILRDDFTRTRSYNRQELDETVSAIARLLCGDVHVDYPFHPQLKNALLKFIDDSQNPASGCWGVWFVARDGTIWRQDDVGVTFHIVSDLDGKVKHLDRIARRVLELRDVNFPSGIRMNGRYENHLNYDVVKIFRLAWPVLDEPTRRAAVAEMTRMLDWCLSHSYRSDGTFKLSELDDTAGDATFYGVSFLREIGFFRKKERFWTDREFPQAKIIYAQLKSRLAAGHTVGELDHAYSRLGDRAD